MSITPVLAPFRALAIAAGLSLTACRTGGAATAVQHAPAATAALHIEGMDCVACTAAIRIALKRLPGVSEATVSFADQQARVDYDPGQVTPAQLALAVNKLGYHASLTGLDQGGKRPLGGIHGER